MFPIAGQSLCRQFRTVDMICDHVSDKPYNFKERKFNCNSTGKGQPRDEDKLIIIQIKTYFVQAATQFNVTNIYSE